MVKAPVILIMKTSLLLLLALNSKLAPATEVTSVDEKLYTVLPNNVMGPARPLSVCVGGVVTLLFASANAVRKSVYAIPTVELGLLGAV